MIEFQRGHRFDSKATMQFVVKDRFLILMYEARKNKQLRSHLPNCPLLDECDNSIKHLSDLIFATKHCLLLAFKRYGYSLWDYRVTPNSSFVHAFFELERIVNLILHFNNKQK